MIDVRKKDFGQVFTPPELVDLTLKQINYTDENILGKFILEPSFGNGAFLEEVVKRIIKFSTKEDLEKNLKCVYGWELDKDLFNETLNKLNSLIKPYNLDFSWNLECTNSIYKMSSLKGLFSKNNIPQFDYIVGNPPYIIKRNIDTETKEYISSYYNYCYNNYDLYYAFFELSFKLLKPDGKIAFITPSTYFYNYSAIKLRKVLGQKTYISKIIDFKRHLVFKDIWTFVCITIFDKSKKDSFKYLESSDKDPYSFIEKDIQYKDLNHESWSFGNDDKQIGKKLDDIVNIYQALNTQRDRIFMVRVESEVGDYCIVSSRFEKSFKIEKAVLKQVTKISKQACIDGILKEYLIFPYEENGDTYKLMDESKFKNNFPLAYSYLEKYKDLLEKRPYKNWYSANDGFMKSIDRLHGKKIVFSYVMDAPNKFHYRDDSEIYYSGFVMKIKDPKYKYDDIVKILNTQETWDYFANRFTTIKTGWSRVKLNVVKSFII
jgi:adenine-specific DNA-methyltransferase